MPSLCPGRGRAGPEELAWEEGDGMHGGALAPLLAGAAETVGAESRGQDICTRAGASGHLQTRELTFRVLTAGTPPEAPGPDPPPSVGTRAACPVHLASGRRQAAELSAPFSAPERLRFPEGHCALVVPQSCVPQIRKLRPRARGPLPASPGVTGRGRWARGPPSLAFHPGHAGLALLGPAPDLYVFQGSFSYNWFLVSYYCGWKGA